MSAELQALKADVHESCMLTLFSGTLQVALSSHDASEQHAQDILCCISPAE